MYKELTKEVLLEDAKEVRDFVVANGYTRDQLIDLAVSFKAENDEWKYIYWLDGADLLNYPSFDSIRLQPRFILKGKEMRSQTDGLIFTQTEPIILVIENFDRLGIEDQEKYIERICKKEDHDYNPHYYLHPKSVVILGIQNSFKMPKISYKLEVRLLK